MTMTTTEQNTLNQALETAGTGTHVVIRTQDGANVYMLVQLVPVRAMTPAQLTTFANSYSVTVVSP